MNVYFGKVNLETRHATGYHVALAQSFLSQKHTKSRNRSKGFIAFI